MHRSDVAGRLVASYIGLKDREHLVVVHLDLHRFVIAIETVAVGLLNEAPVHPREIFKAAVANSSAAVIVGHNHPSGNLTPSRSDRDVYRSLRAAGDVLGIPVIDFLIVHGSRSYSLAAE